MAGSVSAADSSQDKVPTRITSRNMSYSGKAQKVVFEHEVHAVRPDFELWAEKLVVHLKNRGRKKGPRDEAAVFSGKDSKVERIVALRNVRVKSGKRKGRCSKLVYEADSKLITMTGDPSLVQKNNKITGKKIVIDVQENTSEVFSGENERVEAVFYSEPANEK